MAATPRGIAGPLIIKMASNLSQFHYIASQTPAAFDWESENSSVSTVYSHYMLKHERTPASLFADKFFASHLASFAENKRDYESLYVRTKEFARAAAASQ